MFSTLTWHGLLKSQVFMPKLHGKFDNFMDFLDIYLLNSNHVVSTDLKLLLLDIYLFVSSFLVLLAGLYQQELLPLHNYLIFKGW